MNRNDYKNADLHLFYCDKSEWYSIDSSGKKNWNSSLQKITTFWAQVRNEKIGKSDLDFSNFIFPLTGRENFWKKSQENTFLEKVDFHKAKFEGSVFFENVIFTKGANFYQCHFTDLIHIRNSFFKDRLEFSGSNFMGSINLDGLILEKEAYLAGLDVQKNLIIHKCSFRGRTILSDTEVKGKAEIFRSTFHTKLIATNFNTYQSFSFKLISLEYEAVFKFCSFLGETDFFNINSNTKDGHLKFESTKFSNSERTLFSQFHNFKTNYDDVYFDKEVVFLDLDFRKISFNNCEISICSFSNCKFPKVRFNGRMIFSNEKKIPNSYSGRLKHYQSMANIYRQLKTNFMGKRDWSEAGDAYRSEVANRRKAIWYEILSGKVYLLINLFVIWFYGIFSGFQQSVSKPFIWLIITWLSFAFFLDSFQPVFGFNQAMMKSFITMFPLSGKIDVKPYAEHFYFKLVLQRLFSVILLTFFIFSVRARLKQ